MTYRTTMRRVVETKSPIIIPTPRGEISESRTDENELMYPRVPWLVVPLGPATPSSLRCSGFWGVTCPEELREFILMSLLLLMMGAELDRARNRQFGRKCLCLMTGFSARYRRTKSTRRTVNAAVTATGGCYQHNVRSDWGGTDGVERSEYVFGNTRWVRRRQKSRSNSGSWTYAAVPHHQS